MVDAAVAVADAFGSICLWAARFGSRIRVPSARTRLDVCFVSSTSAHELKRAEGPIACIQPPLPTCGAYRGMTGDDIRPPTCARRTRGIPLGTPVGTPPWNPSFPTRTRLPRLDNPPPVMIASYVPVFVGLFVLVVMRLYLVPLMLDAELLNMHSVSLHAFPVDDVHDVVLKADSRSVPPPAPPGDAARSVPEKLRTHRALVASLRQKRGRNSDGDRSNRAGV